MAIIVDITERKCHAPDPDSDAWQAFLSHSVLDLDMFLSLNDSLSQSQEAVASINMESNQPVIPLLLVASIVGARSSASNMMSE